MSETGRKKQVTKLQAAIKSAEDDQVSSWYGSSVSEPKTDESEKQYILQMLRNWHG